MATAWTRAPPVLAAMRAAGRYPESTSRRSNSRERRTAANTTNPVMRVIELSPAVINVRLWPSTTSVAPVDWSLNFAPTCANIELVSRYHTGMKATSRIQANRLRTCAARLSRMAVSSCWRMAARLLADPPTGQVADPVEPLLLEDEVADDHGPGAPFAQLAGELPEGEVGLPVETLVGLVEEQDRRVVHEGEGQAEFLLGPARQGAHALTAAGGIAEPLNQLAGPVGAADPVGGLEVAHVLVHGEGLIEHDRLRAIARPAIDGDSAGVRSQVAREDPEQRRLPGPVLPDYRDQFPRHDLEVDAGQHLPSAERFADAPCCQCTHGLRPLPAHPVTASLVLEGRAGPGCCPASGRCAYHEQPVRSDGPGQVPLRPAGGRASSASSSLTPPAAPAPGSPALPSGPASRR